MCVKHKGGADSTNNNHPLTQRVQQHRNGAEIQLPAEVDRPTTGIHQIYNKAEAVADQLRDGRFVAVSLANDLAQADHDLSVAKAIIERNLVLAMGGEHSVAPSEQGRERVFRVKLANDSTYQARLKARNDLALSLAEAQTEVACLQDKLNILLAGLHCARELQNSN